MASCCCFLIEAILRLSLFRYIVGTILIQFELYSYTHQNKTCFNYVIIFLYSLVTFILLPLILLLMMNEYLIYAIMRCYNRCTHDNTDKYMLSEDSSSSHSPCAIIRVMNYNIQSGVGMDGKLDIERIGKVVKDQNVSILCMEEVEWQSQRYETFQNDDIAEQCGLQHTLNVATRPQYNFAVADISQRSGWYGISIATKFEILETKYKDYPHFCGRNPRKAVAVKLDISSLYNSNDIENAGALGFAPYLWCICTHFQNDFTFDEIYYEARILSNFCDDIMEKEETIENNVDFRGFIICGDLNVPQRSTVIQSLLSKYIMTLNGDTFPSNNPKYQVDHILLRKHKNNKLKINKKESKVVEDNIASDHRPIVAQFHDFYEQKTT